MIKALLHCYLYTSLALNGLFPLFAQSVFEGQRSKGVGVELAQQSITNTGAGGGISGPQGMSVHVLGEVVTPGTYTLRPQDRLLKAIQGAGGLLPNASEVKVELRRGTKKVRIVDLLALGRNGDLSNNPFLQENDAVFVPRKLASAVLQGTVKYPGVYEISPTHTTSAWDLIQMGSGFTVGLAIGEPILVIRYDEKNQKNVISLKNDKDELSSFKLSDGDTLHCPHKFTIRNKFENSVANLPNDQIAFPTASKEVFVLGGVKLPGKFPFVPQARLSQYVAMAGGLSRLGREDTIVYHPDGQVTKTDMNTSIPVNPGDTFILGEDKLGPEFWITLMVTLSGTALTAYSIFKR